MRAGIRSVERGQWEAARALGLSHPQTLWHVVFPQALRVIVPPQVGQFITLVKDTSLAIIIGVNELTGKGVILYNGYFNPLQVLIVVAIIYFTVNFALSQLSVALERRLSPAARQRLQDMAREAELARAEARP